MNIVGAIKPNNVVLFIMQKDTKRILFESEYSAPCTIKASATEFNVGHLARSDDFRFKICFVVTLRELKIERKVR